MAVLTTGQRDAARNRFVRRWFNELRQVADLNVDECLELIEDLDAWLDLQGTAANLAIRAAIRTKASTATKFAALAIVAMWRAGVEN